MTCYKTLYRVMKTADDSYVCTDKKNGNAFLMADAHFVVRIPYDEYIEHFASKAFPNEDTGGLYWKHFIKGKYCSDLTSQDGHDGAFRFFEGSQELKGVARFNGICAYNPLNYDSLLHFLVTETHCTIAVRHEFYEILTELGMDRSPIRCAKKKANMSPLFYSSYDHRHEMALLPVVIMGSYSLTRNLADTLDGINNAITERDKEMKRCLEAGVPYVE